MIIEMSKENSERLLYGFEYLNKVGQNYFASQNNSNNNSTSSGKKFINALLLTPVIVPTAITLSLMGCTYLCLNAVKAQDDDSTLSKVAKSAVRYLIYLAAFVILATCIVLNLAISLIPSLIFLAINKDIFNNKSDAPDTTDAPGQAQPTNTVFTDSEYKEHVNDAFNKLSSNTEPKEPINNENEDLNQTLISRTQPNVQVISRTGNPGQTEETTIVSRINNERIRNGQAVIISKTTGTEAQLACVIAADHNNTPGDAMTSSAAACGVRCQIVDNGTGVDFSFGASVRTGATQEQAMNQLLRSEVAQRILSDCEVEVQAITQVHSQ